MSFDALALTALIWFLAKFLRYAFPPLFETFQSTYHVSNTTVGVAYTGLMLAYAAMQFPSGTLADRFGGVRVITGGALLAALGSLILTVKLPLVALVVAMILVGAGTGAHKTVAVDLLSKIYRERTGRALGILDTLGAFGGVAAPAVVVALAGAVAWGSYSFAGWHLLFLAGGVVACVLALLFALRVPRHLPDDGAVDAAESVTLREYTPLFSEPRFLLFVTVTVLFSFAYNGAVAFLPLYLTDAAHLSSSLASLLYSALFVVSIVQLVTGDVSDRVGRLTVIAVTLALASTGIGILLFASTPLALGAAVVVFGLGSHGFRPVRGAYLVSVIPDAVAGGTLGIVRTAIMGVGAVSPALVGYLSDTMSYGVAFGVLAASMLGSVALVVALLMTGEAVSGRTASTADD